ncbi:Queuine tRNA-ribosyltransferase subunit QTRTD1 like protein [Habropoda laboriosa]|uniref:Queuine tRNA-ribosyltransferase accessory subunit 2 n=1 Tax=Habropoda laboriosa TaxID=597456 RepID=A0A0L7QZU4_9HYME|nr:PREDICTED: queuine tRNA-ribosyltransferase subunit QTRTD1 homolog [Habropoda laboriosa]KOC64082.1 Queuine tRNA-ribosyltransferase subunit QTRTD1 like protein [Habropoda laboriosa]
MKFTTNFAKPCAARIGILSEFERIPNRNFETPLVLIYTKGGCVPHLTKDVFKMVTSNPQLLSISLSSTFSMIESVRDTNINFADFVSMKEYINFLTISDSAYTTPSGFQQHHTVPVWTRNGKCALTANQYMDIIEVFKPDMYVAMYDGDTNIKSSKKRTSKAVQRSTSLFEQCFIRHSASEKLKSSEILGAIAGGYDIPARTVSINYLKNKSLIGYVIDGLHNNGPDVVNIPSVQIKAVVEHTMNLLPADKLKVSMGSWNPLTVLNLVELGIDVFDTSYPYVITENLQALTFLCDRDNCNNVGHVISLEEERYAEDFSPICSHCECLTCKNHTKAYLHHLCRTKELLRAVLLMIHNMHQYLEFFKIIRKSIKDNTLEDCKKKVNLKFKQENVIQTDEPTNTEAITYNNTYRMF